MRAGKLRRIEKIGRKATDTAGILRRLDPTFAATARIWLLLRGMYVRQSAWKVQDAAAELEVHPKTVLRYVRFLSLVHTDGEGEPVVCLERRGKTPYVVMRIRQLPFEAEVRGAGRRTTRALKDE